MERYAERIVQRRRELHLSQDDVATRLQLIGLDLSRAVVSKVELGERRLNSEELCGFALVLEVDPNWLLDWEAFRRNLPRTRRVRRT